ncbi:hypothetical protein MYAM1_001602 [Malassezia yamatoensis]|uniref:Uncharacterized protein n=1 Tax=Malassezia yamatoensis TaxID=253288 RepID=A0AAJ5YR26_9BASI|nr:hypothetical protein MYAM1_001602 [Malassezia yamatoensis]
MANIGVWPGADAIPALEAKASQDLQNAREIHARQPRKSTNRTRSFYWDEPSIPTRTGNPSSQHAPPLSNPASGSMHSRTTSNSFTSWNTNATVLTGQTTPQQTSRQPLPSSESLRISSERPSFLDITALSPEEYAVFPRWVERIKPAHTRRRGLLDEHAAIKFLRNELRISVEDEVKIMSLFERLPLGLTPGHFFAMVRLASWAQQNREITQDLVFTQTIPPEVRRQRTTHSASTNSRVGSTTTEIPRRASESSPATFQPSVLMNVPRAPPRQVADDGRPHRPHPSVSASHRDSNPNQDHEKNSDTRSSPRVVRPKPVVARSSNPPQPSYPIASAQTERPHSGQSGHGTQDVLYAERHIPSRSSNYVPAPDSPNRLTSRPSFDRPSAPQPSSLPQVSPLIQASLNARSEMKKVSRQGLRPKTFTVLSSSSGQVPRHKPRLLTGQEAPPLPEEPSEDKRRAHSINKMSSFLAHEARQSGVDQQDQSYLQYAGDGHTIAPTPSYIGHSHTILPAWLREQQEEGNVSYATAGDLSEASVFEKLDDRMQESLNGSEHAAASINRNTPFFPPHERDLDRVAEAQLHGGGPEQYRELNARTSAASDSGHSRGKLTSSRSKMLLNQGKAFTGMPRRRVDPSWGTLFESGTYAGFKSTPSARDLRLLTPGREPLSKRTSQLTMPPSQEFQPKLAPVSDLADSLPAAQDGGTEMVASPSEPIERPTSHDAPTPRSLEVTASALARSEMLWTPKMQLHARPSELQRFVLRGDATQPQLPQGDTSRSQHVQGSLHDRKVSGSYGTEFKSWSRPVPIIAETPTSEIPNPVEAGNSTVEVPSMEKDKGPETPSPAESLSVPFATPTTEAETVPKTESSRSDASASDTAKEQDTQPLKTALSSDESSISPPPVIASTDAPIP